MKPNQYIAALSPTIAKKEVVNDIRLTHAEIKDTTLPMYNEAVDFFKSWKFQDESLDKQFAMFRRMVTVTGNNPISIIQKALHEGLENLDTVGDLVERAFNEDIAAGGLTFLKSCLMQFVEYAGFTSKYARKFLIYVYIKETEKYQDSGTSLADALMPAEIEWLEANFLHFCQTLNILATSPQVLKKAIGDIPDIVITEENATTLPHTLGENKIDPLKMGFIPVWLNPFYHVGMWMAEWQADRYKAAKEERVLCELRLLNLKKLADGKPDANLAKRISVTEDRVSGLNAKIAKLEEGHHA